MMSGGLQKKTHTPRPRRNHRQVPWGRKFRPCGAHYDYLFEKVAMASTPRHGRQILCRSLAVRRSRIPGRANVLQSSSLTCLLPCLLDGGARYGRDVSATAKALG